jgi:chloramphenicol-sensitive protein RarD
MVTTADGSGRAALLSAIGCYVLWGLMPLLFMGEAAAGFTAFEILAQRALWSAPLALVFVLLAGQGSHVTVLLAQPKALAWLALSALLIATNWSVYVLAVAHHATLEASLGYYINPLLNMMLGLWLFREKIDRWGWVAIGLAALGVLIQALALGRPPWISLLLALSFGAYGVIRKRVAVEALPGLLMECLLLAPLGLAYVVWLQMSGGGAGFSSLGGFLWALSNSPATVVPLALFAWSARRLPLSTIGFIQFLAPTLQFCVGWAAGEPLTAMRALSFVFIWLGAAVFLWAAWRKSVAAREALKDQAAPA